jgi:hypothetical protein
LWINFIPEGGFMFYFGQFEEYFMDLLEINIYDKEKEK